MNNLVIMQEQQAVTTSLMIAEVFGKEHKHVLRDIEKYEKDVPNFGLMFYEGETLDSYNRERKTYFMNRDGFTLLAMSFTGRKALDFKLKYIEAFNQMEKQLQLQAPVTMVEALTLALEQQKELETKNQIIGELKPKADYTDKILKSKSLVTITQIAKDYGMSGQAMNKILNELGIQYKQSDQWLLYQKYQAKGYTHSETFVLEDVDGLSKTVMNTKWTQKGRLFLYEMLKEENIIPVIERN